MDHPRFAAPPLPASSPGAPHLNSEMWETIDLNPPLSISDAWDTSNLNRAN